MNIVAKAYIMKSRLYQQFILFIERNTLFVDYSCNQLNYDVTKWRVKVWLVISDTVAIIYDTTKLDSLVKLRSIRSLEIFLNLW